MEKEASFSDARQELMREWERRERLGMIGITCCVGLAALVLVTHGSQVHGTWEKVPPETIVGFYGLVAASLLANVLYQRISSPRMKEIASQLKA